MSMPATSTKNTKLATSLIDEYALLGWRAMLTEVNPKFHVCFLLASKITISRRI